MEAEEGDEAEEVEGAEEAEEAEEMEEVEEKGEEEARTEGERERWRGCFISFSLPPSSFLLPFSFPFALDSRSADLGPLSQLSPLSTIQRFRFVGASFVCSHMKYSVSSE